MSNQMVDSNQWFPLYGTNTMEVNGYHQLFDNQHSSKYVLQKKETLTGLEQVEGE